MEQYLFPKSVYLERRKRLARNVGSGILLFPGNYESPVNFEAITYPFRQDSTFLYYWGIDRPDLFALIDIDEGKEIIFGKKPSIDDIIWTGGSVSLDNMCGNVGVDSPVSPENLPPILNRFLEENRKIHYLPPYRKATTISLQALLNIPVSQIRENASIPFIQAVVAQRSVKTPDEIEEIEKAVDITGKMVIHAMKKTKPGLLEREVAGSVCGIALSSGVREAFPLIFTVHGEILHNPFFENRMSDGDLAIIDCGAESHLHYAADISRTFPVSGRFTPRQKEIYEIVLNAQQEAISAVKPEVPFRDIHLLASKFLVSGLKAIGLMKGDPDEAVAEGAHTLFFPCGVGHMLGLDVHDMECLGEDHVGYNNTICRDPRFGFKSLRLARPLEKGFVVTIEPGIYFIPELIESWRAEKRFADFIDYKKIESFMHIRGIRVEDDVLVTSDGARVLGRPIPKTIEAIEEYSR